MKQIKNIIIIGIFSLVLFGCSNPSGNNPGTEFMPDMGHSVAYEANLYDFYYYNTWGSEADYHKMAQPRNPVAGTIPRGYAGISYGDTKRLDAMQGMQLNGAVPFHYTDTDEDRTRASNEIVNNPYPISEEGLARAKDLYEVNCGICHGNKGDGEGWLVSEKNRKAVYPAQPANLISDEFIEASNGRYYYAIMYGKNVMGGYADKISYEERWQVIHYIRALQGTSKGLAYNEEVNELNTTSQPLALLSKAMDIDHGHDAEESHSAHEMDDEDQDGHDHGNEQEHETDNDHKH